MKIANASEVEVLDFKKGGGTVPVVVQDGRTGEVLMVGHATPEALRRTLDSGELWLHSRSRDRLWRKGETSGNVQRVLGIHADCDRDTVLARVDPGGPACHTGERSCFGAPPTLPALADTLRGRAAERPEGSYTARLLEDRNLRIKKLGEEAAELVLALADGEAGRIREEVADLLYHALVAALAEGVEPEAVLSTLDGRRAAAG